MKNTISTRLREPSAEYNTPFLAEAANYIDSLIVERDNSWNAALIAAAKVCVGEENRPERMSAHEVGQLPFDEQYAYEVTQLAWADADEILSLKKDNTQDSKISALLAVVSKVPERWAWGSGPSWQCRVCQDCNAVGSFDSWDCIIPHKQDCLYAQAQAAIAAIAAKE